MTKPSRSTETLIQSIREALTEAKEEGRTLCITHWSEADSDAGYLLHIDGRMVAMGEYQFGFSHIDELLSVDLSDEVKRYARSEAGYIAGNIESVDLNDASDPFDLRERLPYAFQADADAVEAAVKAGKLSVEEMFELLAAGDERIVMEGMAGNNEIQIGRDVTVARFKRTEDGGIQRELDVVLRAGQIATGFAGSGYANINVEGGHVCLQGNEFLALETQPRRPHL